MCCVKVRINQKGVPSRNIVLTSIKCYLDDMDVGLMSEEHSISAGLKFEKQIFRVKRRTLLSMTYWLQKRKTSNFVSNTNRKVGFRLINILVHINKNVLGVVWWFHEFTNILRPYSETRHKTQETQTYVEPSEISTISAWTISFIIALMG